MVSGCSPHGERGAGAIHAVRSPRNRGYSSAHRGREAADRLHGHRKIGSRGGKARSDLFKSWNVRLLSQCCRGGAWRSRRDSDRERRHIILEQRRHRGNLAHSSAAEGARLSADRHCRTSRFTTGPFGGAPDRDGCTARSEEHTSELQSLMRISYAVFCLKKKKNTTIN